MLLRCVAPPFVMRDTSKETTMIKWCGGWYLRLSRVPVSCWWSSRTNSSRETALSPTVLFGQQSYLRKRIGQIECDQSSQGPAIDPLCRSIMASWDLWLAGILGKSPPLSADAPHHGYVKFDYYRSLSDHQAEFGKRVKCGSPYLRFIPMSLEQFANSV